MYGILSGKGGKIWDQSKVVKKGKGALVTDWHIAKFKLEKGNFACIERFLGSIVLLMCGVVGHCPSTEYVYSLPLSLTSQQLEIHFGSEQSTLYVSSSIPPL